MAAKFVVMIVLVRALSGDVEPQGVLTPMDMVATQKECLHEIKEGKFKDYPVSPEYEGRTVTSKWFACMPLAEPWFPNALKIMGSENP